MSYKIVTPGMVFNRLTVIERAKIKDSQGKPLWVCLCSCGNYTNSKSVDLNSGKKKSCGCLKHENKSNYSHGEGSWRNKSAEYRIYQGIIQRCCNPNAPSYKDYGGRGITICKEWRASYINFLKDVGRKPSNKHSLDRIDNNLGYCKENCRWVTMRKQSKNKRSNNLITYRGETKILIDWARSLGTSSTNISNLLKSGKDFSEIYNYYSKKINTKITKSRLMDKIEQYIEYLGDNNDPIEKLYYWIDSQIHKDK